MIRKSYFKKIVAAFLLITILGNVVAPTVSYALTSGPTAPEATSFEPVDTTDMVNPLTGDMSYNIPLLEVPGPSGGYPMSLSYHAGMHPGEDASWVGLGWTLNPGAINRSISGYADDHKNVTGTERSFWEGGHTTTYSIGISLGTAGASSVSAGLTISNDTYRGFGVGSYMNVGLRLNYGIANVDVGYNSGVSPYGESYSSYGASAGIGLTAMRGMFSSHWSVSGTFDGKGKLTSSSTGFHNTISLPGNEGEKPGTQASISSSSNGGVSVGIGKGGGQASVHNSREGKISTSGYDYSVQIPLGGSGASLDLGTSYKRYWTDETENVTTNGSLYLPTAKLNAEDLYNQAFDSYDLQGPDANQNYQTKPDEVVYGSFVDYDNYQVLAQGLAGSMRPYHFKSYIYRQNKKENNADKVKAYPLGGNQQNIGFRFIGDFSNRYTYEAGALSFTSFSQDAIDFTYNSNEQTGETGDDGYDQASNVLFGSRSIVWYSNKQIVSGSAKSNGFIGTASSGFVRDNNDQVGGFKIKNSSGVTYHYSLPVYSYDEYTYSGRQDEQSKYYFNEYKRTEKYAYTWLLTALTGPDYYDKNQNGLVDEGDFGYWVSFNYGKWTDNYMWRNPALGFNRDLDRRFNFFSKGKKEIYYLNSVVTETHTALFVKELRQDGKGGTNSYDQTAITDYDNHAVTSIDNGNFSPVFRLVDINHQALVNTQCYPRSLLKLSKIYLLKNEDLQGISNVQQRDPISKYVQYKDFSYSNPNGPPAFLSYRDMIHLGSNVIDIYDVSDLDLAGKSIRSIEFNADYSLVPGTDNSFISAIDAMNNTGLVASSEKGGKLTLNSLKIGGRNGESLPETKFTYDLDESPIYMNLSTNSSGNLVATSGQVTGLQAGDIVKNTSGSTLGWYLITKITNDYSVELKLIGGEVTSGYLWLSKTKNPPYNKDYSDLWGMYKSDYTDLGIENISHKRTDLSRKAIDVWSLRQVESPTGAKISFNYESDQYDNAIKKLATATIKDVQVISGSSNEYNVVLYDSPLNYGFKVGQSFQFHLAFRRKGTMLFPLNNYQINASPKCNGSPLYDLYDWDVSYIDGTIKSIGQDFIIVDFGQYFGLQSWLKPPPYHQNVMEYIHDDAQSYRPTEASIDNMSVTHYLFETPSVFVGGEMVGVPVHSVYGGDIRVTSVTVDSYFWKSSTKYSYSGGVTSYEPIGYNEMAVSLLPISENSCVLQHETVSINSFKNGHNLSVYQGFMEVFKNSRELPGPCVLYSNIKVSETQDASNQDVPGYTMYEYANYTPDLVSIPTPAAFSHTVKVDIYDYSSRAGILKKVTMFDSNNQKVSETAYNYLHDNIPTAQYEQELTNRFLAQGLIEETFVDARKITNGTSTHLYAVTSQRHTYPSIQVGQTTTNFKTGLVNSVSNVSFDYYSGQVTSTLNTDGYGNSYLNVKIPAYRKYSSMGIELLGGANMLTQEAGNYTYKVDASNTPIGLISASAQTWSNNVEVLKAGVTGENGIQSNIWRMHSSYSYTGDDNVSLGTDGLYPYTSFNEFTDWSESVGQANWQKNSEITLYDTYSHALEAMDVNSKFAATVMTQDQTRVSATAANARYDEIGYSGAEDVAVQSRYSSLMELGGNIYILSSNGATRSQATAHSGSSSLEALAGQQGFVFYSGSQQNAYHVSVWSSSADAVIKYQVDGGQVQTITPKNLGQSGSSISAGHGSGTWNLLEADVSGVSGYDDVRIWCEASGAVAFTFFDDFRVHPVNAVVTSYVYNEWGELSHILNANNLYTRYEYDGMGRLVKTYQETLTNPEVMTGQIKYNYAKQ